MDTEDAADASTWLAFALGDLESARARPGRRQRPRIVSFHAQQAAETALKAALVLSDIDPPRTHDLMDLLQRLPDGWRIKDRRPDLVRLSRAATDSRYPEDMTPVSAIEAATAVRQAAAIMRSIREDFERRGVPTAKLEPR
jgi:HEPN domain-containing protein